MIQKYANDLVATFCKVKGVNDDDTSNEVFVKGGDERFFIVIVTIARRILTLI